MRTLQILFAWSTGLQIVSAQLIVVNETFESYADSAAMYANWARVQGTGNAATLDGAFGNPGKSAFHDGTASATGWIGSTFSLLPTDFNPVVLKADLYYTGNNNQRNTVGLRNGSNPLFEIGFYNSGNNGLGFRVLGFGGNEGWVQVLSYTQLGTGAANAKWIRVEATFTGNAVNMTFDLGADGTVDATASSVGAGYANPFVDLRFGGPSAVSSSGGGFWVDNISLVVIPEPSAAALGLIGGVALLWALRRRAV